MHTYLQNSTSYILLYTHGPGSNGLCRKKKKQSNGPVHGPPLQARVAAANGTVLAACKLLALTLILAHMDMKQVANKAK